MYLVQNDKGLGSIGLIPDMINFIDSHHLLFEHLRTRFVLEFVSFRSFWCDAFTMFDMTYIEVTGAIPSSSVVIFLPQNT